MAFIPHPLPFLRPHPRPKPPSRLLPVFTAAAPPPDDIFQTAATRVQTLTDTLFDSLLTPFSSSCSVLQRRWTTRADNFILRPAGPPKAVLHFLGGAFFAAAPHILYHSLLERLCAKGFVIVATAYEIGFDYLQICAKIADSWERVEQDLALEYGPLPIIGIGHSAGGVFQVLLSTLFAEAVPRIGNILIAFSNRDAGRAIPGYDGVVRMGAAGVVGVVEGLSEDVKARLFGITGWVDRMVEGGQFVPRSVKKQLWPSWKEGRRVVEQVWPLLEEVAGRRGRNVEDGERREFYPSPEEVGKTVEKLYDVEETLVVQFGGDELDDSEGLIGAMRTGGIGEGMKVVMMRGWHLTPLGQEVPNFVGGMEAASGVVGMVSGAVQEGVNAIALREMTAMEAVIDEWVANILK